jgi:AraC-like DNA-binding protein
MTKNRELFFDEEARRLIDSFALCFKIHIRIFSAGMDDLMAEHRNSDVPFCHLIREGLGSYARCCRQAVLIRDSRKPEVESMVYHCYAGLAEGVVPVKLRGILVGYALLDQFRIQRNLPESLLRLWVKNGSEPETLITAFSKQPFFDQNALENMLHLFSMLITFLFTREYVKIRRTGLAENVVNWLETHITEPMDLNRIASIMNRSRSTISHTIKRQLGMSFKELCILKRIQHFERIIAGNPGISIREAAALAGYRDPFYFSRIYKKVRFSAPSAYLKSQRKKEAPENLVI